jgi:hypothetical protein
MKKISLSFCSLIFLEKNKIAEIIINDGELLNLKKTSELNNILLNQFKSSFQLLINKKHSYCYTFKAMLEFANIPRIRSIAIINYSEISEQSTNFVMRFGKKNMIKYKNFYDRKSALNWLKHINYT